MNVAVGNIDYHSAPAPAILATLTNALKMMLQLIGPSGTDGRYALTVNNIASMNTIVDSAADQTGDMHDAVFAVIT